MADQPVAPNVQDGDAPFPGLPKDGEVKAQIQDIADQSQYSVGAVQYHIHNGTDSPNVDIRNISRFPSTPTTGDLIQYNGNRWVSVASGTSGYVLTSNGTGTLVAYLAPAASSVVQATFTTNTRQSMTKGSAVAIGNGTNSYVALTAHQLTNSGVTKTIGDPSSNWFAESFIIENDVTAINTVSMWFVRGNAAGTETGTVSIRGVAFIGGHYVPTGSDLGSGPIPAFGQNQNGVLKITMTNPVSVTKGTRYAIVVRGGTDVLASSGVNCKSNITLNMELCTSTDSGSTWGTDPSNTLYFDLDENIDDKGLLSLTNTNSSTVAYWNNFIGFANQTVGTSVACVTNIGGIDSNQTGLTVGTTYFLNDADGAIGITPGTNSRKVGLAVGTSQLLIKFDNV